MEKVALNMKIRWILYTAFSAVFVLVFTGISFAGLMLMQPSVKLFLKQGEKHSGGIILQNISDQPLKINAEFADELDKDMKPVDRACAKWVKLDESEFTIPANGFKDLRYTVDVPLDVKGGYWTGLVYSYDAGKMPSPGQLDMDIKMHIEEPINISIMDTVNNDFLLTSFEANYSGDLINISAKMNNTGNCFEEITSYFLVYDASGRLAASLKYPAVKIYPDKDKVINVSSKTKLDSGKYRVVCLFDYSYDKLKVEEKGLEVK